MIDENVTVSKDVRVKYEFKSDGEVLGYLQVVDGELGYFAVQFDSDKELSK